MALQQSESTVHIWPYCEQMGGASGSGVDPPSAGGVDPSGVPPSGGGVTPPSAGGGWSGPQVPSVLP